MFDYACACFLIKFSGRVCLGFITDWRRFFSPKESSFSSAPRADLLNHSWGKTSNLNNFGGFFKTNFVDFWWLRFPQNQWEHTKNSSRFFFQHRVHFLFFPQMCKKIHNKNIKVRKFPFFLYSHFFCFFCDAGRAEPIFYAILNHVQSNTKN